MSVTRTIGRVVAPHDARERPADTDPVLELVSHASSAPRAAATAAVALIAVGVVHLIDAPASLRAHFYIGSLELALAAVAIALGLLLVIRPAARLWAAALVVNLAGLAAYLASRTVGLPGSSDDIGNWSQLLGVISVLCELSVIGLAAAALSRLGAGTQELAHIGRGLQALRRP